MLAWFLPLFFFAALMGSPVPGFLVFMLLGIVHAWRSWRQPQSSNAFRWTRQDTWLALCFVSIPLFKLLTLLWSSQPQLVMGNVAWHLYFLFWPLVLIGLAPLKGQQQQVDQSMALGLIAAAAFLAYRVLLAGDPDARTLGNVGITAQLAMAVGGWNLLALTRSDTPARHRALYGGGFLATWLVLVFTTRRLELLGFAALSFAIGLYRLQRHLNRKQMAFACLVALLVGAAVLSLRWEKFALGLAEIQNYFSSRAQGLPYQDSSWGARLEMWRLGWLAFTEHPWLGIGASARPHDLPGAPPMAIFGHRHFHSHLMQTAVEGGLLGLLVWGAAMAYSTRTLIVKAWNAQRENALLAASLLLAYALEGAASAALVYDKPNALLVVMSCWVWLQTRAKKQAPLA